MRYLLLALALVACGKPAAPKKYGSFLGQGFVHSDRDTLATLGNSAVAGDVAQYDGTKWKVVGGVQSDTSTGTVNNLAITDGDTYLDWNGASSVTFTGFQCGAADCTAANNGQLLVVEQLSSSGSMTFDGENAGSHAANRIIGSTAGSVNIETIPATGQSVWFRYDGTALRWRSIGVLTPAGIIDHGTVPSLSAGCGTGATVTGGLYSFEITIGTAPGTCTATFAIPTPSTPTCFVGEPGAGGAPGYTPATTSVAIPGAYTSAGRVFDVVCVPH